LKQGKAAEAERLLEGNLQSLRNALGADDPETLMAVDHLALALQGQGKVATAERLLRKNLDDRRRVRGDRHPDTLVAIDHLASLLLNSGQAAEAERLLCTSLELRRQVGSPPAQLAETEVLLGRCLRARRRYGDAERLFLAAYARLRADGVGNPDSLAEAADQLVALYEASGEPGKAAEWREKRDLARGQPGSQRR
jgi:tetratricopeptide (TPR) repeat protein